MGFQSSVDGVCKGPQLRILAHRGQPRPSRGPFDSYGLEWPIVVEFHGGTRTDAVVQLAMGYEELLADAVAAVPAREGVGRGARGTCDPSVLL